MTTSQNSHSQSTESNTAAGFASVADLLGTKGKDIFTIGEGETLRQAVEALRDRRIGALPVVDAAGGLCGILSERDIVRKLAETPGTTLPRLVGEVMTRKVETCTSEDPLATVLKRMTEGRFRHMPVMQDAALAGMITIGDVIGFRLREVEHEALQLKQLIVG